MDTIETVSTDFKGYYTHNFVVDNHEVMARLEVVGKLSYMTSDSEQKFDSLGCGRTYNFEGMIICKYVECNGCNFKHLPQKKEVKADLGVYSKSKLVIEAMANLIDFYSKDIEQGYIEIKGVIK